MTIIIAADRMIMQYSKCGDREVPREFGAPARADLSRQTGSQSSMGQRRQWEDREVISSKGDGMSRRETKSNFTCNL